VRNGKRAHRLVSFVQFALIECFSAAFARLNLHHEGENVNQCRGLAELSQLIARRVFVRKGKIRNPFVVFRQFGNPR
jgi:hypothetical protein